MGKRLTLEVEERGCGIFAQRSGMIACLCVCGRVSQWWMRARIRGPGVRWRRTSCFALCENMYVSCPRLGICTCVSWQRCSTTQVWLSRWEMKGWIGFSAPEEGGEVEIGDGKLLPCIDLESLTFYIPNYTLFAAHTYNIQRAGCVWVNGKQGKQAGKKQGAKQRTSHPIRLCLSPTLFSNGSLILPRPPPFPSSAVKMPRENAHRPPRHAVYCTR